MGKLSSNTTIGDGRNHHIRLRLTPAFISIRVDKGTLVTQAIPKAWDQATSLYVGGYDIRLSGPGVTRKGLQGCLPDLVINGRKIDFQTDPLAIINVVPCQVNEIFGPEVNIGNYSMDNFDEDAYLQRLNRIGG